MFGTKNIDADHCSFFLSIRNLFHLSRLNRNQVEHWYFDSCKVYFLSFVSCFLLAGSCAFMFKVATLVFCVCLFLYFAGITLSFHAALFFWTCIWNVTITQLKCSWGHIFFIFFFFRSNNIHNIIRANSGTDLKHFWYWIKSSGAYTSH